MIVTLFKRPHGLTELVRIRNIDPADHHFLESHNVKVSMEFIDLDQVVVYGDYGAVDSDGNPDEIVVISGGRSCLETMRELRILWNNDLGELNDRNDFGRYLRAELR